jgi:hypothetical protein
MLIAPLQPALDPSAATARRANETREIFRYITMDPERTAGSVPVWRAPLNEQESIEAQLNAIEPGTGGDGQPLRFTDTPASVREDARFTFADILDMINPLQHLPILGSVYRYVTGDDIKPTSQLIGGAAFGGFLGAASGVANIVSEAETGKSITENVMAQITGDDADNNQKDLAQNAKPVAPNYSDTTIALANLSAPGRSAYNA